MNRWTDPVYLRQEQYRDSTNFNARAELHQRYSTNPEDFWVWVFNHLGLPGDAKILELGGGSGLLWQKNLSRIPSDWEILFSDLSLGMIKAAVANLERLGSQVRFAQVDIQCVPAESNAFDAVLANHMLYHVENRSRSLGEVRRVLRPGGTFYATTVGDGHLYEVTQMLTNFFPQQGSLMGISGGFTLQNGLEQLQTVFDDVRVSTYPCDLRVTEPEPLIKFLLSLLDLRQLGELGTQIAALSDYVHQELATKGAIDIRKETGVFIAR